MSILESNLNDDAYANSNSANNYNKNVLSRLPTNSNFNGAPNTVDFVPIAAPADSWSAVIAVTVAATAIFSLLIILVAKLGMSSASVFSGQSLDTITLGTTTLIWLAITQRVAYSSVAYLAGKLRVKTVSILSDKAYFRTRHMVF